MCRQVKPRKDFAKLAAMLGLGSPDRNAVKEADDGGGPFVERAQNRAIPALDRQRACETLAHQMFHQVKEEGQVAFVHPLFEKGEDVAAGFCAEQEVGVLNALRDALEGQDLAKIVVGQKGRQIIVADVGVNGHEEKSAVHETHVVGA